MQTYERRPHARRASTSSLPAYSTTSMSMNMMNVGAGGTMHRRTGSASPPAWKPVLKVRYDQVQWLRTLHSQVWLLSSHHPRRLAHSPSKLYPATACHHSPRAAHSD